MPRLPILALAAALIALSATGAAAASPEREQKLMEIAASCAAFYQAGFDQLDLPVERNEDQRQAFIAVVDALSAKRLPPAEREPWFMEHVVDRTSIVGTLIQMKPDEAGPKVRQNLGACDGMLPEMKAAAGLE